MGKIDVATLDQLLDDIFDKTSCYYPIDFSPPKNDKHQITMKDLQNALDKVFLASVNPYWTEIMFPFIIEKLASQDDK